MSDAGEELNEFATELEMHALKLPRPLAAMVLAVAAARIAGDAEFAETQSAAKPRKSPCSPKRGAFAAGFAGEAFARCCWDRILAHHRRGWDGTTAGYARENG